MAFLLCGVLWTHTRLMWWLSRFFPLTFWRMCWGFSWQNPFWVFSVLSLKSHFFFCFFFIFIFLQMKKQREEESKARREEWEALWNLKEDWEKKIMGRYQLFLVPFSMLEARNTGSRQFDFIFIFKEENTNDLEPERCLPLAIN